MAYRFTEYVNGSYVRLSLIEGQTLRWHKYGPTDEGWSSREETWSLEDGVVINTIETDGRDCDGRHSYSSKHVCRVDELEGTKNVDDVMMPHWRKTDASQRDYSAEAMGY